MKESYNIQLYEADSLQEFNNSEKVLSKNHLIRNGNNHKLGDGVTKIKNLPVWGGGESGGVLSVTGDLTDNSDPVNPKVNLPSWVNDIRAGRLTGEQVITGSYTLKKSDAGSLIISGYEEGVNNEIVFENESLNNLDRFVILNENPIKLTEGPSAAIITPQGFLPEASGNGELVWIAKTDSGTYYAVGGGLKMDPDYNALDWSNIGSKPTGTDRQVIGLVDGEMEAVTLGWKQFSDVLTPPNFSNGALIGTGFDPDGSALFGFKRIAVNDTTGDVEPISSALPLYTQNGQLRSNNAVDDKDVINKKQAEELILSLSNSYTVIESNASRTLSRADVGKNKMIVTTGGSSVNFTLVNSSGVPWVIGDTINIFNANNSISSFFQGSGVNIISVEDMKNIAPKGRVEIVYINANTFGISGDLIGE